VIDTAMAGRLSAIDLASVGIAASIMATVLMTLISVLLALPPIIAHLYGAGRGADVGREIHQSVWISLVLVLALVAILLLCFPGPLIAISHLQPIVETKVRAYLAASAWGVPGVFALRIFLPCLATKLSISPSFPRITSDFASLVEWLVVPLGGNPARTRNLMVRLELF
jgi:MATE family multidrug resistance protein